MKSRNWWMKSSFLTAACLAVAASRSTADQACATMVSGGITSPGSYAGIGDSCSEARADPKNSFGFQLPTCGPCVGAGCHAGASFDDPEGASIGNCNWDAALGKWVIAASVGSPAPWSKTCSPCLQPN